MSHDTSKKKVLIAKKQETKIIQHNALAEKSSDPWQASIVAYPKGLQPLDQAAPATESSRNNGFIALNDADSFRAGEIKR
ncbi:MAG: hypothetical protein IT448_06410 [Phycisphaerales bacterium]|nr:hypothetical protein [Phycisphaerales bacterium]